jgi:hypothetical protein
MAPAMFIELGMGVDLQGQDATKAATRAVRDAIGRNYLPGIRRMLESSGGRMLGGFKRSSQRVACWRSGAVRQTPRPGFSNQGSCGVLH